MFISLFAISGFIATFLLYTFATYWLFSYSTKYKSASPVTISIFLITEYFPHKTLPAAIEEDIPAISAFITVALLLGFNAGFITVALFSAISLLICVSLAISNSPYLICILPSIIVTILFCII